VAHPGFKDGRHSRYVKDLPRQLRARMRAALADPELASLGGELALLETRIGELLRRLGEAPAPPWSRVLAALAAVRAADDPRAALDGLERVVRAGADAAATHAAVWKGLTGLIDLKARVSAAENKRLHDAAGFVKVGDAMAFVTLLLSAAREVVTDPATLRALQQRVVTMLPAEDPQ
jgi:hypothetical protein